MRSRPRGLARGEKVADRRQARTDTVGLSRHCGLPDPAAQWRPGWRVPERRSVSLSVIPAAPSHSVHPNILFFCLFFVSVMYSIWRTAVQRAAAVKRRVLLQQADSESELI